MHEFWTIPIVNMKSTRLQNYTNMVVGEHEIRICQGSPSQCPPLHHFPSSSGLNIDDALKLTKFKKRSKPDLAIIEFDNIDVYNI